MLKFEKDGKIKMVDPESKLIPKLEKAGWTKPKAEKPKGGK